MPRGFTRPKIRKILLPIDVSEESIDTALYAATLAKDLEVPLTLLHVVSKPQFPPYFKTAEEYYTAARKYAGAWFYRIKNLPQAANLKIGTKIIMNARSVVGSIAQYAEKENSSVIIMGSRGRSRSPRMVPGSVASGVASHASCPVLIVKGRRRKEFRPNAILFPTDGSEASFKAARYAVLMAGLENSRLIAMHAVVVPPYLPNNIRAILEARSKESAGVWLKDLAKMAKAGGITLRKEIVMDAMSAATAIIDYAEKKDADLIVMGSRGRTSLRKLLLGSVAQGVVTHAQCPVLVVR